MAYFCKFSVSLKMFQDIYKKLFVVCDGELNEIIHIQGFLLGFRHRITKKVLALTIMVALWLRS